MKSTPSPWAAYEPSASDPWDLRKVAHLHRRAGFGAPLGVLKRDLADGPGAAIDRLLDPPAPSPAERETVETLRRGAAGSGDVDRLKAYWLYRIIYGNDPLRERLTLSWHGHFATSIRKVKAVGLMAGQLETLRRLALDDFGALLLAIVDDPAMLAWLDGAGSRKARPNENFAREFLELFTLGPGHYAEADVRESARAFAGWKFEGDRWNGPGRAVLDPSEVDDGPKTFLGRVGRWRPGDIVRIVLDRPEAAESLARRLWRLFVGEREGPDRATLGPLAATIRSRGFAIRPVVAMILRSRAFFASTAYRERIKGPVEFSAGLARMLDLPRAAFRPMALAAACDRQGQELCAPPNVKGWDGGKAWLNGSMLLERGNWANDLIWGRSETGLDPFDPIAWADRSGVRPGEAARALGDLLLQGDLAPEARALVLRAGGDGRPDSLREALQIYVNCPEFQLA